MHTSIWFWIAFNVAVLAVLAIDLLGFNRKAHTPSTREAAIWSGVWIALSLAFNALIWRWQGAAHATEFLAGYLIEYSLSVDNIFVFVLIFARFSTPPKYQHRVLFWGILSALVLRGVMIGLGTQFVARFSWAFYVFGALLVFTGAKMLFEKEHKPEDAEDNAMIRFVRRILPITGETKGPHFLVREGGRWMGTPLLLVLVLVEATDVLFALDSIPAVFGVTRDPFIVYTSNVCAILGLRSLYFLLAGAVHRFTYLKPGLALILAFIGAKMLLNEVVHVPTGISLAVVGAILGAAIALSLWMSRGQAAAPASA